MKALFQNKKLLYGILIILLALTGFVVYKAVTPKVQPVQVTEDKPVDVEPTVDASVSVQITKSKTKDNYIVLDVSGLAGKYTKISYELTYDTKGVTQGSIGRPIDATGQDTASTEIYLGTCSRNVCTPHLGVTKISAALEFTDSSGKKSQFSKDYNL